MAVEDGAALARALGKISSTTEIQHALSIFEEVRAERTRMMQDASLLNGQLWHFPDGPLQQARDEAMKPETLGIPFSHSPNQWSDPATQMWAYGYDAERAIDEGFRWRRQSN
jgi:salicylate hydroxylase